VFISGVNFIQMYSSLRSQKVKRSCDPHIDGKLGVLAFLSLLASWSQFKTQTKLCGLKLTCLGSFLKKFGSVMFNTGVMDYVQTLTLVAVSPS